MSHLSKKRFSTSHALKSAKKAKMDFVHIDAIINLSVPHIGEDIFNNLGVDDLIHCEKVSKTWKVLAETVMNKKILHGQWKGQLLKECLKKETTDIVKILLVNGHDFCDEYGKTCFMWAIENGLEQTVKNLLPNLSLTDINKKDRSGITALMYGIKMKNESVADQLLNLEGIEVDFADKCYGMTCLMWASRNNLDQIVIKLVPKLSPESIGQCDNIGWNAFLFACNRVNHLF